MMNGGHLLFVLLFVVTNNLWWIFFTICLKMNIEVFGVLPALGTAIIITTVIRYLSANFDRKVL